MNLQTMNFHEIGNEYLLSRMQCPECPPGLLLPGVPGRLATSRITNVYCSFETLGPQLCRLSPTCKRMKHNVTCTQHSVKCTFIRNLALCAVLSVQVLRNTSRHAISNVTMKHETSQIQFGPTSSTLTDSFYTARKRLQRALQ